MQRKCGSSAVQVMVEARLADGLTGSVILQNAETVKLVSPAGQPGSRSMTASVSTLKAGDRVLVHAPETAARHTGLIVKGAYMQER